MSDQIFWYITRSSALVAWLASSLSLLIGLLTSSRLLGRRPTIPWLTDIHRYLSGMSMVFLAVHMASLWADEFVSFSPAELFIPWVAEVGGLSRTGLALGVIAAWLLALIHVTSLFRDHLPNSLWRTVHLTSFGVLLAGTVHGIQTGSDIDNPLVAAVGLSLLTAIVLATAMRVVRVRQRRAAVAATETELELQAGFTNPDPETTIRLGRPYGEQPPQPPVRSPVQAIYEPVPRGHEPVPQGGHRPTHPQPARPTVVLEPASHGRRHGSPDPHRPDGRRPGPRPRPEVGDTGSTRVVDGGW